MKISSSKIIALLVTVLIFGGISCKNVTTGNTDNILDSFEPVEEVIPVESGENVSLTVNINAEKQAYFDLDLENLEANKVISNGKFDGWCIDVFKPLNTNDGVYNNVKLFSTDMVEGWLQINYLLNIREELKANDSDLTWRDIQVAIWSMLANPKFSLDDVPLTELPSRFHEDGEPLFSYQKVEEILELVGNEYEQFDYTQQGTKYAVIVELPVDVQTVFAVVEKN